MICPTNLKAAGSMIKLNCVICGKEFEKQACWKNVSCCSKKCGYEKRKRNPRKPKNLIKKICVGCGKQFEEYPSNTQKFCTHKCYLKTKSNFVKYPNAQRLQTGKVDRQPTR